MSSSHVVLLVLLSQVDFPSASSSSSSSCEVLFSTPPPADFCPQYDFSKLDAISQIQLQDVLHKKAVFWSGCHCHTRSRSHTLMSSHSPRLCVGVSRLTVEDRRLLWEKRAFCQAQSAALPLVLASAPCWQWSCLPDIYALLKQWACLGHLDALGLLHSS